MKIAIAYAGKTGTTERAAGQLAQALQARGAQTVLCDLTREQPDLTADALVVGGSVRIGSWHKAARAFAKENAQNILQKPLALFACRCSQDDLYTQLAPQIGHELADHAAYLGCLGGELNKDKQKGMDRFVVNMISRSDAAQSMKATGILPDEVNECADAIIEALSE